MSKKKPANKPRNQNANQSARDCPEPLQPVQEQVEAYAAAVETGDTDRADKAALAMLALAGAEAANHPTPELLLAVEAETCESAADWAGAEAAYRKLLAMY